MHIYQVVVSDWQNWCRNFSDVNIGFQRGSNVDCSAEYRNGMTSVKDAEYSWCLSTGSMYRNVEHIYGIWHERSCITIHNLANEFFGLCHQILTPD